METMIMSRFLHIVGTRPNFIKAWPVIVELNKLGYTKEAFGDYSEIEYRFVDTRKAHKILGVTFDDNLDDIIKEMYEAWKIEK